MMPYIYIITFSNKEIFGIFVQISIDGDGKSSIQVGSTTIPCNDIKSFETENYKKEWIVEREDGYDQYSAILNALRC